MHLALILGTSMALLAGACASPEAREAETTQNSALALPGRKPPSRALLDKMEQRIAELPCIGPLDAWDRQYQYKAWMSGTVFHLDIAVIEFTFAEAGKFEFKRGRHFYVDPPTPKIDDRSYRVAHGHYDMMQDRATLEQCGSNFPSTAAAAAPIQVASHVR